MKKITFYIVDVFAEKKYSGNQLAVFRNTKGLSASEMQKIARETNFSETTFIHSEKPRIGGYDVRIFTPEKEVPFAGHPTLGTAYVIQREIIKRKIKAVNLNLAVGVIPITFSYKGKQADMLWMKQKTPSFYRILDPGAITQVLNIPPGNIDKRFPIQDVSTGLPFIIVPLKTLNTVNQARINRDKLFRLIKNTKAKAILIFCPQTYKKTNNLNARVFADYYGVPEDPATGSANGCLAGYLVKHKYFGTDRINIKVEQGYRIGRPSLLFLKAEDDKGKIDVFVGGRVQSIARGTWR